MLGATDHEAAEAVTAPCHRCNQQQTELVAPAGTHPHMHSEHVCMPHTRTQLSTQTTDTQSTPTNTESTNSLILTPSLAEEGGGLLSQNVFVHTNINI